MLTLADALVQSLATAAPRVRYLVSLTLSSGVTHSFVSGEDELIDDDGNTCAPEILEVSTNALDLDAFTREVHFGEVTLRCIGGGGVFQMVAGTRMLRALVLIRMGTEAVGTADYVTLFRGSVNAEGGVRIAPDGTISLTCVDAFALLAETVATFSAIATHPLEALRQLLAANVAPDLFASTGWDFESDTTRSHWSLSRYEERLEDSTGLSDRELAARAENAYRRAQFNYRREPFTDGLLDKGQEVWGLAQELLALLHGTVRPDANGRLEYVAYDAAAAPVAHWPRSVWTTRDEIDAVGHICNRGEVTLARGAGTSGSPFVAGEFPNAVDRIYADDDAASQTAHRLPGSTVDRVFVGELKNPWLRVMALVSGPVASPGLDPVLGVADTTMYIQRASEIGFTGARYRYGFRGASGGGIAVTAASITGNVATLTVTSHWLETGAYITTSGLTNNVTTPSPVTVVSTTQIQVALVGPDGAMADGSGFIHPEQDPLDTLTDGRVAWFAIAQTSVPGDWEIVRATAGQAAANTIADSDPREVSLGQYSHPEIYQYTIERAQLGTTAQEFAGLLQTTIVYDITQAVEWAQARLDRHAYGAPEVVYRTLLSEIAVQVGDFVTVEDPSYVGYLAEGATEAGPVFEVTSKNLDGAEIEWGLTWVRDAV